MQIEFITQPVLFISVSKIYFINPYSILNLFPMIYKAAAQRYVYIINQPNKVKLQRSDMYIE